MRDFFQVWPFLKYSYCRDHSILFVGAKWTKSLCILEWRRNIFFQWQHHYSRKKINTHYQKIKTYFNFPWIIVFKQLSLRKHNGSFWRLFSKNYTKKARCFALLKSLMILQGKSKSPFSLSPIACKSVFPIWKSLITNLLLEVQHVITVAKMSSRKGTIITDKKGELICHFEGLFCFQMKLKHEMSFDNCTSLNQNLHWCTGAKKKMKNW